MVVNQVMGTVLLTGKWMQPTPSPSGRLTRNVRIERSVQRPGLGPKRRLRDSATLAILNRPMSAQLYVTSQTGIAMSPVSFVHRFRA
jgi:hypothetical protein